MTDTAKYIVEIDLQKRGDLKLDDALRAADRLDQSLNKVEKGLGKLGTGWKDVGNHGAKASEKIDKSLKKVDESFERLKTGWQDLSAGGSRVVDVLDGVASKAWSLTKVAAMVGGVAAFAGMTYGVVGLNAELEKMTVSLGTIFKVQEAAPSQMAGMKLAGEQIAKMRVDAQQLPGEFQDLFYIYNTGAVTALRTLDPDKWRDLSAKAMAAAKATSVPIDQAGRELAMLLEGRAGAHNVFGMRLLGLGGASAEKFNKSTDAERVKILTKELDKYADSIEYFGKTFDAASSTFIDDLKQIGQRTTEPLFNSVTKSLQDAHHWLESNKEKVDAFTERVGNGLADAWEWGAQKFEEYWPRIVNFIDVAWERLSAAWEKIAPWAERFETALQRALDDPNGTIDKLVHLAELYIAIKGGSMVLGGAGSLITGGMMLNNIAGGAAGVLGGGGAAAAAGTTTAAGASAVGGGGLAALGAGATTAAIGLAALLPAAGGLYALYDKMQYVEAMNVQREQEYTEQAEGIIQNFKDLGYQGTELTKAVVAQIDASEKLARHQNMFSAGIEPINRQAYELQAQHLMLALRAEQAAAALAEVPMSLSQWLQVQNFSRTGGMTLEDAKMVGATAQWYADHPDVIPPNASKKAKPSGHHGGGGTHVQKVEIVITTNQNPSRVAQMVKGEFEQKIRHLTSSRYVPNYGAGGG